ncbi:lipase family protein [Chitinophaga filiformis]|uniref:Fungal lipase-type domain-containing protein n=1 Tax=Chitinophaga filiformis TaxID=104663 RepID=A0ABY4I879_CHIFI|nr:hypothetical protein [Chitinophaga filiformis]UPK72092.1 hypothetical protein MYF79_12435 [Chitinophaga filiformis]
MGTITRNTSGSNQTANAQIAVQLCAIPFSTDPNGDMEKLGWKIVWNGIQTIDANYAFIAVDSTGNNYALIIRGSVPPHSIFSDWDLFANWVLEDLGVVTMAHWPYASTPKPMISTGAYIAFTNMLLMQDSLGSGLSINEYLLANTTGNGKQLIIAGHSLGGNIANVYTSFYVDTLKQQGLSADNISLFTFAAPAAGNGDFANDLDAKLPLTNAWHYQNSNDIVPNFPVFAGLVYTATLYAAPPEAAQITVTYQGQTVSLGEAFLLLAGVFLLYGYQQPQHNYTIFKTDLYGDNDQNTVQDWFGQAGDQHALSNYANYLGVTLPVSVARQPLLQPV